MQPFTVWHRFLSDRSGAFLPIFAVIVAAMLVSVGMGLDYARALNDRGRGQAVADAMVLAMAQELRMGGSSDAARDVARRIYDAHYGRGSDAVSLEIRTLDSFSGYDLIVALPGRTETTLMKLAGFDDVPWQVTAASRVGFGSAELTFVADVSSSMLAPGRMEELRASLRRLVQIVFPGGLTPLNRVVTLVPFSESVNLGTDAQLFSWLDKAYRLDVKTGYGIDPFLLTFNGKPLVIQFVGCFRRDFSSDITDPAPGSIGTLAPFYPTVHGGWPLCPSKNSEVLYFENDPSAINTAIARLDNGYSTGTDEGLLWGWRTLSPLWRSRFPASSKYPLDFQVSKKVLILLTDGGTSPADLYGDGGYGRHGYRSEEAVNIGLDRLAAVCDAIRDEGQIEVNTIGYAIPPSSSGLMLRAMNTLKQCPSNGGRHYDADVSELTLTIEKIAPSINSVRLHE